MEVVVPSAAPTTGALAALPSPCVTSAAATGTLGFESSVTATAAGTSGSADTAFATALSVLASSAHAGRAVMFPSASTEPSTAAASPTESLRSA